MLILYGIGGILVLFGLLALVQAFTVTGAEHYAGDGSKVLLVGVVVLLFAAVIDSSKRPVQRETVAAIQPTTPTPG